MPDNSKRVARKIFILLMKVVTFILYLLKIPYWALVGLVIKYWGRQNLHSITVGEFSGGELKTRSSYREEMLLKSIILLVNLREKSCLDLACNDGFWSFRLARFGLKTVTGIDKDDGAIIKANFLKQIYDYPSHQYKVEDLFEFLYGKKTASYDIVLLLSIIYHLPENAHWDRFFEAISQINNDCLIIDSRWFEDEKYWYDKTGENAVLQTADGAIKKWRPLRKDVFDYLHKSGYEQVVEINPSGFLSNSEKAFGNGDPYTKENVSDYITDNRSLIFAFKKETITSDIRDKLGIKYV